MKVLIVTQDRDLGEELKAEFLKQDANATLLSSGLEALEMHKNQPFDLAIIDWKLYQIDGISLMKDLKSIKLIPCVIMSERPYKNDVLYAYSQGCQDYLRKPIIAEEVALKIKNFIAMFERVYLKYGGVEIDTEGRKVLIDGVEKNLTQKEFQLLLYLARNQGTAIRRDQIFREVWGYDYLGDDRTIDTHIKMLRSSLGPYKDYIQTYRGFGYKFEVK